MLCKIHKFKGQSSTEYIFFLLVLFAIFIYFQKYIVRAISGRLKTVGESFADGRLYDPTNTVLECAYDFQYTNLWYDARCYFGNAAQPGCGIKDCLAVTGTPDLCETCIRFCSPPGGECNVPVN